jgi:hypothetical protein
MNFSKCLKLRVKSAGEKRWIGIKRQGGKSSYKPSRFVLESGFSSDFNMVAQAFSPAHSTVSRDRPNARSIMVVFSIRRSNRTR